MGKRLISGFLCILNMKKTIMKVPRGANIPLGKYFNSSEMDCKCNYDSCTYTLIDMEHMVKMNELREQLGKPIKVTSAYRCEKHNADVGGSTRSQHLQGTATDIQVKDISPSKIVSKMRPYWKGGLGKYNTFTHLDSREGSAYWDLSSD